nr:VOC family protein [Parafrankia discariae]
MIRVADAQFWVHDQEEALAFYPRTLGREVRVDQRPARRARGPGRRRDAVPRDRRLPGLPRRAARARGGEFNDPPTRQPYGIDTSFRDPSGNNIRLTRVLEFSPDRT